MISAAAALRISTASATTVIAVMITATAVVISSASRTIGVDTGAAGTAFRIAA